MRSHVDNLVRRLAAELAAAERSLARERERLAELEREHRERLAEFERRVQVLRGAVGDLGLPNGPKSATIRGVDAVAKPGRIGRPVKHAHQFTLALKARGSSITKWAEEHQLERHHVQSWVLPPPNQRSIPLEYAKLIEAELGVPLSAWGDRIR